MIHLEDRRKELRKKESQREKVVYAESNKTLKKKHRQRSRKKEILLKLCFKLVEDETDLERSLMKTNQKIRPVSEKVTKQLIIFKQSIN